MNLCPIFHIIFTVSDPFRSEQQGAWSDNQKISSSEYSGIYISARIPGESDNHGPICRVDCDEYTFPPMSLTEHSIAGKLEFLQHSAFSSLNVKLRTSDDKL